ncbi:MAG: AMP-binding protein [Syntrophales bacterium]|nr:AMP-binding protein [Syntrophales bacterium]MCK9528253.1 AMP-binding protein [Syntrophales bacterium]MDX9922384.1 AMP-binding protein [Syntrophales bacterium]
MHNATLCTMIDCSSRTFADSLAIVCGDREITYGEFITAVDSVARALKGLGLGKGDSVALMLPNVPEFVISYFAILKIGGVVVTLNTASTSYELNYYLDNSDAKALITSSTSANRFEEIRHERTLCRHLIVTEGDEGDLSLEDIMEQDGPAVDNPELTAEDPAVIVYTAGLTGKALGAVLTHGNLYAQSCLIRNLCQGNEKDRSLALIPLYHTFGATANMLCALNMGATMIMMNQFNLDSIFRAIETGSVTYLSAVPRLFLGMMLHEGADRYNVDSLRLCITGGSAMPVEWIPVFEEKFKVKLMEGYGLTEASPVCSFSLPERKQKPGSIGVAIGGVTAKIFDDDDRELPAGETGELVIRGPNVMKEYYKEPERTAEVLRNGWLHTGDLAWIDEDGDIFLVGRKKRMIITSGFNVYPKEVETILTMHKAIRKCVVVGKEDLMRGEIIKALVVLEKGITADAKEIMRHCRHYLASYKVPREIEFVERIDQEDGAS